MVEIIAKRDGPRRELIEKNRATIVRLADQISGGGYSASKVPRKAPEPEGLIIHVGGGPAPAAEVKPSIRVTLNGRVISMDRNTSRQLRLFGEIRDRDGKQVFVLATKQNGFYAPIEETIAGMLADLDGRHIADEAMEERLAADIGARLGIG
jgi:hypothetical protein